MKTAKNSGPSPPRDDRGITRGQEATTPGNGALVEQAERRARQSQNPLNFVRSSGNPGAACGTPALRNIGATHP